MVLIATAGTLPAQVRPTPAQAQALLSERPELVNQLRQRIVTSGMNAEQVRSRLRAEGYPENLLDAYLPGATTTPAVAGDDVFAAVKSLGIVDDGELSVIRNLQVGFLNPSPPVRDDAQAEDDSASLVVFGLNLFRSSTNEFAPTLDGPVDPDYRLGPGDQLVLILTGQVELAHTLEVTREGFIVIPQVGQLNVANLTLTQLEDLLYQRLPASYSGVRRGASAPTHFSVTVSRLRAIQVYVTGDVLRPGSYRLSSAGTVLTALYAAGGPTENGTMREVVVRRGSRIVTSLDVYDYLLRGDNSKDLRLENGDLIFVATHGPRVRMSGQVLRPATYELRPGESLRDALDVAGGFRATAATRRIQVQRIVPGDERTADGSDRILIDVPGTGTSSADFPALPMEAGDVVKVFPVAARVRDAISVSGNVWVPGTHALSTGMTLSDALRAAGGLKSDTYLGQVLVSRLKADSTREQLRATLRDSTGAVVDDFRLVEDDEIRVFSLTEFRPERHVAIGGSVRSGGRYPWREGMTLRDLILMAGGLREGAYLNEAEIARLPVDRSNGATAVTVRVALDSSYLAEYVPGVPYSGAPGVTGAAFRSTPEVALMPYDNVLILEQPDWQLARTVVLSGEVKFPGRYALKSKTERLRDVIERAGGLTGEADAQAAFFARRPSSVAFAATAATEPAARIRVGVDLSKALSRPSSDDNFLLIDGDSLNVPFRRATVEVRGAVNAPTAVVVDKGKSLSHYIRAAGGRSINGDRKRAYVVQPNGKIESRHRILWLFVNEPEPRAGATVVVPVKAEDTSGRDRATTAALIAQTLASLAAVAALLRR